VLLFFLPMFCCISSEVLDYTEFELELEDGAGRQGQVSQDPKEPSKAETGGEPV